MVLWMVKFIVKFSNLVVLSNEFSNVVVFRIFNVMNNFVIINKVWVICFSRLMMNVFLEKCWKKLF